MNTRKLTIPQINDTHGYRGGLTLNFSDRVTRRYRPAGDYARLLGLKGSTVNTHGLIFASDILWGEIPKENTP